MTEPTSPPRPTHPPRRTRLIVRLIAAQGLLLLAARVVLRIVIAADIAPDWDAHLRLLRTQSNIADACVISAIVVFITLAVTEARTRRRTALTLAALALALLAAGLLRF